MPVSDAEGRLFAFASTAPELDPVAISHRGLDVYLQVAGGNGLENITSGARPGTYGNSYPIGFAGDDILFLSDATDLFPGVTNTVRQLFVENINTRSRRLLSRYLATGLPAAYEVGRAVLSASGRYVFIETSSGLTGQTEQGAVQIFRCDLQSADQLLLVSSDPDNGGPSATDCSFTNPSSDGERISYSTAMSGSIAPGVPTLFVKDMTDGTAKSIALGTSGVLNGTNRFAAGWTAISSDGRYVVTFNDTAGSYHPGLNWFDLVAGTNDWCEAHLAPGQRISNVPEWFPGGRTVGFETVTGNPSQRRLNFWDADRGLMTFASFLLDSPLEVSEPASSWHLGLSPDGTSAAFFSDSTNLVPGIAGATTHLYLRNLATGATRVLGYGQPDKPNPLALDADFTFVEGGRRILLADAGSAVFDAGRVGSSQVFVIDLAGQTSLISVPQGGANLLGTEPLIPTSRAMSGDGRFRVFMSFANDLAVDKANGLGNVFMEDRTTRRSDLISAGKAGAPASVGSSFAPQVSLDGTKVLYLSSMATVPATGSAGSIHAYVKDLRTGQTEMIDPKGPGNPNGAAISTALLGKYGRYVVYQLSTSSSSIAQLMLKDLFKRASFPLGGSAARLFSATLISDDDTVVILNLGTTVAHFSTDGGRLLGRSSWNGGVSASLLAVSRDGGLIAGAFSQPSAPIQVFRASDGNTAIRPLPVGYGTVYSLAFRGNGESLIVEAGTTGATANSPVHQLFAMDLASGATKLITTNRVGTTANGISRSPSLSADGQWMVFVSDADDLVQGATSHRPNVYRRDMTTGEIVLVSRTPEGSDTIGSSNASISDDGSTILFTSRDNRLAPARTGSYAGLFAAESLRLAIHLDPSLPRGPLALSWDSEAGVQYRLQYRDQPLGGLWQDTSTLVTGDGSNVGINVPVDSASSQYFRIVEVQ